MKSTIIKIGALAAVAAFATGCENSAALQNQVDALQTKVAALEAQVEAAGDNGAAAAAQRSADQAQACCDATNERVDRMFQQSQSK